MILNTPVLDSTLRAHVFTFKEAPIFSINNENPNSIPDLSNASVLIQEQIEGILHEFLEKAARYFSRPLDLQHFQKRLHHIWKKEDSTTSIQPSPKIHFCFHWIPDRILFYQTKYEIYWNLKTIQPILVDDVLHTDTPSNMAPPVVNETEGNEIPFREVSPQKEEKKRAKKVIRHARLRIALAQLRAERLAEKYYRRYGTFECEEDRSDSDGDSELSIDSQGPYERVSE
jgi:hypothetical protein